MHPYQLVLFVQYDGTDFFGFQRQPNQTTIQGCLERAISKLTDIETKFTASGRTDRGVHARGQVISLKTDEKIDLPLEKIPKILNNYLPKGIYVTHARRAPHHFNARFYAQSRRYSYNLITKYNLFKTRFAHFNPFEVDKDLLFESANLFIGEHDFTTFSKLNKETKTAICKVSESYWEEVAPHHYVYNIKANRFIYSMVRSLVGVMLDIGRGKRTIEGVQKDFEAKDRELNSMLANPEGLCLEEVYYNPEFDYFKIKEEEL